VLVQDLLEGLACDAGTVSARDLGIMIDQESRRCHELANGRSLQRTANRCRCFRRPALTPPASSTTYDAARSPRNECQIGATWSQTHAPWQQLRSSA
jgi:hypothetical protein